MKLDGEVINNLKKNPTNENTSLFEHIIIIMSIYSIGEKTFQQRKERAPSPWSSTVQQWYPITLKQVLCLCIQFKSGSN